MERLPLARLAVVALERRPCFGRHIGSARCQLRPFCVAEVLRALPAVREIRAFQFPPVAIA